MSYDDWHDLVRDAVLETDFGKLLERIEAAETAIAQRSLFGKELTVEECLALETCLYQLRSLRQERTELHRAPSSKEKRSDFHQDARRQPTP